MDYTVVGKIINTHGVKGEVKVFPLTDDMERFSYLKKSIYWWRQIRSKSSKCKISQRICYY